MRSRLSPMGDEIGQFHPGAETRRGPEDRHQEPGRPFQRRVRHPQPRRVEDRQARHTELGVIEVELMLFLIVHHAAGADFPQGRRVRRANLAGRGDDPVEHGEPPAGARQLVRRDLKLLVEHHPGAGQNTLGQVARQVRGVGDDNRVACIGQADRAGDLEPVGAAVIDDALGRQPACPGTAPRPRLRRSAYCRLPGTPGRQSASPYPARAGARSEGRVR